MGVPTPKWILKWQRGMNLAINIDWTLHFLLNQHTLQFEVTIWSQSLCFVSVWAAQQTLHADPGWTVLQENTWFFDVFCLYATWILALLAHLDMILAPYGENADDNGLSRKLAQQGSQFRALAALIIVKCYTHQDAFRILSLFTCYGFVWFRNILWTRFGLAVVGLIDLRVGSVHDDQDSQCKQWQLARTQFSMYRHVLYTV